MRGAPLGPQARPTYEVLDARFEACIVPGGRAERIWTGGVWTEGPAWFDEGVLIWSDIPNDRMLRWTEADGAVSTFRQPSGGANGNTLDREGRLVTCEQGPRRVTRTEPDGTLTVLADRYGGRRFNSPNDVVVRSDGTIWFTDPAYGASDRDGTRELDGCHVYRIDPARGETVQMTDDMVMPNGLAFSPDEGLLYVIDTGSTHFEDGPNHVRRFEVGDDGALSGGEVFADSEGRSFDGLRIDSEGRLWCGSQDGAHVFAPDGTLIGKLRLPERASNLTFGGRGGGWVLLTATTSVYRIPVRAEPCRAVREGRRSPFALG